MAMATSRNWIALVQDGEIVPTPTSDLLQCLGFTVKPFKSGDALLQVDSWDDISCVLLDLQMPGYDGPAALRALAERGDSPPILVLTAQGGMAAAVEAIRLGAHDFIEQPCEAEFLVARIEAATRRPGGERAGGEVDAESVALVAALSRRQRQVLDGIGRGLQNKIIAYELGLSIRTIEAYRAQLLDRLGARGTADAVRVPIAAGLLQEPTVE